MLSILKYSKGMSIIFFEIHLKKKDRLMTGERMDNG